MTSYGPASAQPFTVDPDEMDRFLAKVDRRGPHDCWPWRGATGRGGYGTTTLRYRKGPTHAHRVSWVIANRAVIPSGMCVLHKCDNKICVNPSHLEIGDHRENMRQAVERGRMCRRRKTLVYRVRCWACGRRLTAPGPRARCRSCRSALDHVRRSARADAIRGSLPVCPPSTFEQLVMMVGYSRAFSYAHFYGLYDCEMLSKHGIGLRLGVSRERARQFVHETPYRLLGHDYTTSTTQIKAAA